MKIVVLFLGMVVVGVVVSLGMYAIRFSPDPFVRLGIIVFIQLIAANLIVRAIDKNIK
mgnify:CR=1 FL=1